MKVTFLGLGKMGIAVARQMQIRGYAVRVWNRSPEPSRVLASAGAEVGSTPADAAANADLIFSMLADDNATRMVVLGEPESSGAKNAAIEGMRDGAVHICLGTISVKLSRTLTELHRSRGQDFVAAPVFGRPIVAEQGKLWVAMAGANASVDRARPVLESVSRGISVVSDEPWRAHALKLGGNYLIAAMVQALSEGFVFAESQGIAPELFLETVNHALFQSPFFAQYGKNMLSPPQQVGAPVSLGSKDTALFREAAAEAGCRLPMADYIAGQLGRAVEAGMKDSEWAVAQYRMAQSLSRQAG